MKRTIVTFMLLLIAFNIAAQSSTEYNIKGDEAKRNSDYSLAKMWYEVGLDQCNPHSIEKLHEIWLAVDEDMRITLRSVMARSFNCISEKARQNDTISINMLISFYENGIGTEMNKAEAEQWKFRLEDIRNPYLLHDYERPVKREREKMEFFAGYSGTFEAPFGLTVGGVGRTVGWYLRFRSNLSSQNFSKTYTGEGDNINIAGGYGDGLLNVLPNKKVNTFIGTGGLVFKLDPSFYLSVGGGYVKREYLREFQVISDVSVDAGPIDMFWAKHDGETSFGGAALDLDGTFKINKFYVSLGCSMLNFKYVSANAGIGLFF